ncbi:MAG: CRTAC1 family protein [Thermoanaerobaculia bacterium]
MKRGLLAILIVLIGISAVACGGGEEEQEPVATESALATSPPDGPPPLLVDATDEWNVRFTHDTGAFGELAFPEMNGGGVAVFDANEDGRMDLYFVSGAPKEGGVPNRLFIQGEDGRFTDATKGSGLGDEGYGTGVAVGDVDNDGHEDVFVANIGPDRLYRGRGDGTFEDVTASSGVTATGTAFDDWSSSAAFCDIDRDGFLDLYVVRYVVWDPEVKCTDSAGRREYCGPDSFPDRTDVLLRNQDDGTFRDVTASAGIDVVTGAGLGVVCEDVDDNGWVDIYVANDGDPNQLWMNQGDGTFIDDALIMGASVNAAGVHEAGMGVVSADFDNDGDFDLFLTHLRDETNTFYRNLGSGIGFEDQTVRVGLAAASTPYTGFGTVPLDLDLDGDLDIVIANGRVLRGDPLTSELPEDWNPYAEPNLVYANDGGIFRLLKDEVRDFVDRIEVSRGLAKGDLDGDGDLDLAVNSIESPARLYRTEPRAEPSGGHWLVVDTLDPRLKRRALGARVTVTSGESRQSRTVQSAMSYLSSSDPRAHFGLGAAGEPVAVAVRWPDGLEETWSAVGVDQVVVLERGTGE